MRILGIGVKVDTVAYVLCSEDEYKKIPTDLFLDSTTDYLINNEAIIKVLADIDVIDLDDKTTWGSKYIKECNYIRVIVKDIENEYSLPPNIILDKLKDRI